MNQVLYNNIVAGKKEGKKRFVVLLDPDKTKLSKVDKIVESSVDAGVDIFFLGGSLVVNNMLDKVIGDIKAKCDIPLVLFPGDSFQLSYKANALLFLSLISGRNADLLIGKHVITAPYLKMSGLEIISTGYMLIDGGIPTSVSYMSNTYPIPKDKNDIALCTALAGEMLGLKTIFMDAGSGAKHPVSPEMIEAVSGALSIPLIVGGGIRSPEKCLAAARAGADAIVVGDAIEKDPILIREMAEAVHSVQSPQSAT